MEKIEYIQAILYMLLAWQTSHNHDKVECMQNICIHSILVGRALNMTSFRMYTYTTVIFSLLSIITITYWHNCNACLQSLSISFIFHLTSYFYSNSVTFFFVLCFVNLFDKNFIGFNSGWSYHMVYIKILTLGFLKDFVNMFIYHMVSWIILFNTAS